MDYFIHVLIVILIFGLLAMSLDLLAGYAGQMSLGHAVFFGAGAYSSAILSINFTTSVALLLLWGGAIAGGFGLFFAILSMRLSRDEFAIATFAAQGVFTSIVANLEWTGGARGISDIPDMTLGAVTLSSREAYFTLLLILVLVVGLGLRLVVKSRFGLVYRAVRDDELLVAAFGYNLWSVKMVLFLISAAVAGVAGVIFAHYFKYVEPYSFTIGESFLVLLMVSLGGGGRLLWAMGGAMVLIVFPELLRFMSVPNSTAAELRQIVFGVLLIILTVFKGRSWFIDIPQRFAK